jgi:hypothetical protein
MPKPSYPWSTTNSAASPPPAWPSSPPGQTLQPTALVHEAWLRLTTSNSAEFANRAHFFAAASEAMRRILIERARRKFAQKRGGRRERISLDEVELAADADDDTLLLVNDALEKLKLEDPRAAELVTLRFFGGLKTPARSSASPNAPPSASGPSPAPGFTTKSARPCSATILSAIVVAERRLDGRHAFLTHGGLATDVESRSDGRTHGLSSPQRPLFRPICALEEDNIFL